MERYKKPEGIFQNIAFVFKHDGDPAVVEMARNHFLEEQRFVKFDISIGIVTIDELKNIANDPVLQNRYKAIMHQARGYRTHTFAQTDIYDLTPKEVAGWLDFRLRYYEKRWSLRLLSDEERVLPYNNL
jgi:hypothetical protein